MIQTPKGHFAGITAIILASFLWGTTGVSATFAPDVSAIAIGAAAMGFGGLLQAAIAITPICRSLGAFRQQWHLLLLGAVAVAVYPLAFYGSMRLAGVTIGTVVSIGTAPVLLAIIEIIMDGARMTLRWLSGAVLGLTGIALLSLSGGTEQITAADASATLTGVVLGLLAAFTYALYSWAARRLMQRNIPSRAAMGGIFGIGGLLLMPVLALYGAPFLDSWQNAAVGIYMACVPMFMGYVCFGYALARIPASTATTITLLEPVIAAALAALIVGEQLTAAGWAGVALIFTCLVCITLPARRKAQAVNVAIVKPDQC
ncbi:EamA family transporter [Morganella morganii]|uniref:DMT family transporter n=1 Tax=Morganella morganii TaxID=582 RepID=UPI001C4956B5|nr:EamA family transporter [Morganella morganii]QXO57796.1 EamA family transporter [Morganella morganii]QXO76755.1 EamA family transporter [Morganella morganii]